MSFFLPSLSWSSSLLQLLLAPLVTNSQGQKEVLVPGSKDEALLPSTPFHSMPALEPGLSLAAQGLAWWSCFPRPATPVVLSHVG